MTEIIVKGPLWLTPLSSTCRPLGGTSFSLYYFLPSKGRLRSGERGMPLYTEVLDYGPMSAVSHFPLSSLPFHLFPTSPFSATAESQPTAVVFERSLSNGSCKTFHEQCLMNVYKPCKVLPHCPFTLLSAAADGLLSSGKGKRDC